MANPENASDDRAVQGDHILKRASEVFAGPNAPDRSSIMQLAVVIAGFY